MIAKPKRICRKRKTAFLTAVLFTLLPITSDATKKIQVQQGAYRVDLNGKVRDLCVNEISLAELSAAGWQERLSEQGVRCKLSNVLRVNQQSSWTGTCSSPGMGKVFDTRHDVRLKIIDANEFEILTIMSGDLQARIPVRARRLSQNKARCDSQHDTFRAWQ